MSQENGIMNDATMGIVMDLYADEDIVKGTVIDGQGFHAEVSKDEDDEIVFTTSNSAHDGFDLMNNGVYSVTAYDKNGYQKPDFKMPDGSEETEEPSDDLGT